MWADHQPADQMKNMVRVADSHWAECGPATYRTAQLTGPWRPIFSSGQSGQIQADL